jgi:hypothetical protein
LTLAQRILWHGLGEYGEGRSAWATSGVAPGEWSDHPPLKHLLLVQVLLMKRIFPLLACATVILVRMADTLWNPVFGTDKLNQLAGAINLLEGHGVSYAYSEAKAPAVIYYKLIDQWPPGYSWLAAAGIFLTSDLYYAVILNDLFFTLLQLVSAAWLISLFPRISSHTKMFWFWAFALNTNLVYMTATDTAAMGGYTLALACVLYSIQQQKGSLWAGITAGMALTFCLVMRYAYLPQAVLMAVMLTLILGLEKNKDQLRFVVSLTVTLLAGFAVYYLLSPGGGIHPVYSGRVVKAKSFFPEHVIRFNYAFIYQGFFSVSELRLLVAEIFGSAGTMYHVAVVLTKVAALIAGIAAMIALIVMFGRESSRLFNKRSPFMSETIGHSSAFALVLCGGMGCNVLLLVYLSLTNPMQTWAKDGWTFVQEARYYVPSWLSLWIAGGISLREKDGRQLWNSIVYWTPIILLAVNVVTFGYYERLSIARQPDYPSIATCAFKGLRTLALSGGVSNELISNSDSSPICKAIGE